MKKIFLSTMALAAVACVHAQTKPAKAATAKVAADKAPLDSFSYAAGMSIAESMMQAGVTNLNTQTVAKAMNDVFSKSKTRLTTDQANMTLQEKLMAFQKKKSDGQKAAGNLFLEANSKRSGVTRLPNGLQYEIIKAGDPNGPKPKAIDTVVVNYKGTLTDGKEFDNSFKRGQPATFPLNGVIKGWTEILQLMPKGSYWKVYIPGDLAYGENPPPGAPIPPNAVLIFEIQLEDIKPANAAAQ